MLQSLLQPSNQRTKCTAKKMIGAMPAVAVRHERRRGEKRGGGRRPSQLPLQLGRMADPSSPASDTFSHKLYFCRKTVFLHAVVGSLLLGIVILVVGLVQLSPGAEAAQHRYFLMGSGGLLFGAGLLGAILRCVCTHCHNQRYEAEYHSPRRIEIGDNRTYHEKHGGVCVVETPQCRPKLKTQASVGQVDLIKQPSAGSDT